MKRCPQGLRRSRLTRKFGAIPFFGRSVCRPWRKYGDASGRFLLDFPPFVWESSGRECFSPPGDLIAVASGLACRMNQARNVEPIRRADSATSHSLLDRVRCRDEVAWRQLTELYGPLVYHWARQANLGPEDSADLVQDVFRSLVVSIGGFEKTPQSSFRAWLWTIARNKIRDHYRTNINKVGGAGGTDAHMQMMSLPDREPDPSGDSALSEDDGLTNRALKIARGEVQEHTWQAFWRTTMDGVAPAAVAAELDMSVDSVYQAKSRVLRRVREMLEL